MSRLPLPRFGLASSAKFVRAAPHPWSGSGLMPGAADGSSAVLIAAAAAPLAGCVEGPDVEPKAVKTISIW